MIKIGPHNLQSRAVLAPMAGTTDLPFRKLCRGYGAGLAVAEMLISDRQLWHTRKSYLRLAQAEGDINAVQIAGADPEMMADAAQGCEALGADIIDINMGCPAKKVCKKAAGSALLKEPELVKQILDAVVSAVSVPVTLKIRTGWSPEHRNGVEIAKLAEDCGIASLAVHGRTRACRFKGEAEYDTIAAIKQAISIPVFANGDIDSAEKAEYILQRTGADGVMIGRGAQGRPWLFREINERLSGSTSKTPLSGTEIKQTMLTHISDLHQFYGEFQGLRIARKHVAWYLQNLGNDADFRRLFNGIDSASGQLDAVHDFFEQHAQILQEAAA
ncbi:tRNA-U20-dihydrouridine synthase [Spongiibacter sp. IMCC21906]|jgi:tRNA-dihydrouridine synthase B|uniref:tRNA dihydrouridine synthase DusB n=1 Tax=Spongiibacter sp. IMCC21906 TaxID=1620392 RepID=UPI00062DD008|nr:tRNA dihydrouridine synthase DusB [Spongiibacter sp. IMCC21906]AKH68998.1 tRNA-U20-dihydrouridine synthase [Spongiibacter sp. IMCC21906]